MKKIDLWRPTKYEVKGDVLRCSFDPTIIAHGRRLNAQLVADAYTQFIPRYCRGDLIDIGCGRLPLFGFYRRFVDSVTAVDWENSVHVNEHLDIVTDLSSPPIPGVPNDSFDCAILSDVLEHIFEPRLLLGEIARIVKPGGSLLMNVPFYDYIHEIPFDFHRYTEFALRRYLEESGFEVVHLDATGGVGASWISITSMGLSKLGPPGRGLTTVLQRLLCRTRNVGLVRRFLAMQSDRIPLAYFVVAKRR